MMTLLAIDIGTRWFQVIFADSRCEVVSLPREGFLSQMIFIDPPGRFTLDEIQNFRNCLGRPKSEKHVNMIHITVDPVYFYPFCSSIYYHMIEYGGANICC